MKRIFSVCFCICILASLLTKAQTINTIAGNGVTGYSGDGGQATVAELNEPFSVVLDASGNIYIADGYNQCIRKVSTAGVITTIAGNGTIGYSGDGGPATNAELFGPGGLALDATGNIYFADQGNQRVRMVSTTGIITTFAGNGNAGYNGDGGQATAAELHAPSGAGVDASGNVYIADYYNEVVRKVSTSGVISTFAGNGSASYSGDGGQATAAGLNLPLDVRPDASGNIYIADLLNGRVRKVNTLGVITTVAGNGVDGYTGDGGQATAAEISRLSGIAIDQTNLYIGIAQMPSLRKVDIASGIISTMAGNGLSGYFGDGGPATASELNDTLGGVAVDKVGNVYVCDQGNNRVREITAPLGILNIGNNTESVSIYPDPSKGDFALSGLIKGEVVEIYNEMGQKVLSKVADDNPTVQFNITDQANGIYLVWIKDNNGKMVVAKKLLKTDK